MLKPKYMVRFLWISFFSFWVFILLLVFSVKGNMFGLFGELPGLEDLENPKSDVATEVISADGKVLGSFYREKRIPVQFNEISPDLLNALVATEDERFEKHSGVDMKGTFAIFYYLIQGKKRGSSTLSQQTAKNLFRLRTEARYKGPLARNMLVTKVKEWIMATRIERAYTKKEIITMYLNTVDFGRQAFGIYSASKMYFGTTPDKLSKKQCAMLVGILQGPSVHDPIRHPESATRRRNTVFDQMVRNNFMDKDEADKLSKEELGLKYTPVHEVDGEAPYFCNYIKPFLKKWAAENDVNLYSAGLKIYTSVDYRMQTYAEKAVKLHMKSLQDKFNRQWKGGDPWKDKSLVRKIAKTGSRYKSLKASGLSEQKIYAELSKPVSMTIFSWEGEKKVEMSPLDSIRHYLRFLHTGLLSLDPHTGHIKAWVGGIDHEYFKFDHVWQSKRQPGSTFKPFVYAYSIEEKGMNPCSEVLDIQVPFKWGSSSWMPKNSGGKYHNAPVSLKFALANSINSVAASLMMQAGPDKVAEFASRMGITSKLDPVPALALGASDVNLFEMVSAYCVFANGGTYINPIAVLRIEDKEGNTLEEFHPETKEVLSEETAYYMVELLKAGPDMGTSRALRKAPYRISGEIGGKTGTTQGSADGWFIGISPELVTGVWVGGTKRDVRILGGQGATLAMPIWGYYMMQVLADENVGVSSEGYHWSKEMPAVDCPPAPVDDTSDLFEEVFTDY